VAALEIRPAGYDGNKSVGIQISLGKLWLGNRDGNWQLP
jgi:hypothetical protein